MVRTTFFIIALTVLPYTAFADFTGTQNFDSLSTGDLTGQGTFSGSASYDVVTDQYDTTPNAMKLTANGTEPEIYYTWAGDTSGIVSYMWRRTAAAQNYGIMNVSLRGSTQNKVYVSHYNGSISLIGATTIVSTTTTANDTWYQVDVDFDTGTDKARFRVNEGEWSALVTFTNTATVIDRINWAYGAAGGESTQWFDSIQQWAEEVPPEEPTASTSTSTIPIDYMNFDTVASVFYVLSIAMGAYFALLVFRFFAG